MSDYDEQIRLWHEGKITARPIRFDSIHDKDIQIAALRAENERLLAAMVKARDGLRWSQIHLREADMCSVSVEVGLDAAQEVLERKPE